MSLVNNPESDRASPGRPEIPGDGQLHPFLFVDIFMSSLYVFMYENDN